jgi:hypothetical protein
MRLDEACQRVDASPQVWNQSCPTIKPFNTHFMVFHPTNKLITMLWVFSGIFRSLSINTCLFLPVKGPIGGRRPRFAVPGLGIRAGSASGPAPTRQPVDTASHRLCPTLAIRICLMH